MFSFWRGGVAILVSTGCTSQMAPRSRENSTPDLSSTTGPLKDLEVQVQPLISLGGWNDVVAIYLRAWLRFPAPTLESTYAAQVLQHNIDITIIIVYNNMTIYDKYNHILQVSYILLYITVIIVYHNYYDIPKVWGSLHPFLYPLCCLWQVRMETLMGVCRPTECMTEWLMEVHDRTTDGSTQALKMFDTFEIVSQGPLTPKTESCQCNHRCRQGMECPQIHCSCPHSTVKIALAPAFRLASIPRRRVDYVERRLASTLRSLYTVEVALAPAFRDWQVLIRTWQPCPELPHKQLPFETLTMFNRYIFVILYNS